MSHGDINFATADCFFYFIIIACKNKWVIKVNKLHSLKAVNATSRLQMESQESYNSQSCLHSFASPWTSIKISQGTPYRHCEILGEVDEPIDISSWYEETKKSLSLALAGGHIEPETVEKYLILPSGDACHNKSYPHFFGLSWEREFITFYFKLNQESVLWEWKMRKKNGNILSVPKIHSHTLLA